MKYPVGTVFTIRRHRKRPVEHTVVDYHVTRNLAGDVVRERYVTAHQFMGQTLFDGDVVETTIAMALAKEAVVA